MKQAIHPTYHEAVTVTCSCGATQDFEINARGTLNVLEAARQAARKPAVIYASTNKVYGGMETVATERSGERYAYRDLPDGIPESQRLDFHSPYGCSKGAADQYVRDYARIYGVPTVVLRQSCVYGPRQFGVEDQGWIAWFTIAALLKKDITIYGDGKQVRDVLFIDDLALAYEQALTRIDAVTGQIFNVGGGPEFALAVQEVFPMLERRLGRPIPLTYGPWRPGDQPVYISDITKAKQTLDWQPRVTPEDGVAAVIAWSQHNLSHLRSLQPRTVSTTQTAAA